MAPFFGFLAENISISLYPVYLIAFIVLMAIMSERVNTLNSKSISKESEVNNIT